MSKPNASQILDALKEFLAQRFDIAPDSVTMETPLRDLGLDSMMVLDIMLEAEDRFGVKLMDLVLPRDPLLGDVVTLIERNVGAAA